MIEPADSAAFRVDRNGIISVVEGATPIDTTLRIEVSNDDETEIVSVAVTVADAPSLNELPADATTATIMENAPGGSGASGTGTVLISGITPTAPLNNPTWEIRETVPTGFAYKFAIVDDGATYNLVLKEGESLDFEAIPGGVMNLRFWVVENNLRSNALEVAITITDADDAPVFQQ